MSDEPPKIEPPEAFVSERQLRLARNLLDTQFRGMIRRANRMIALRRPAVLYVSGPFGINKSRVLKGILRSNDERLKHEWEDTDEDRRLPYLTERDENNMAVYKPSWRGIPPDITPAGFVIMLREYRHPKQALLLEDTGVLHEPKNVRQIMAWGTGDRIFGRFHSRMAVADAEDRAHSIMYIVDNFDPNKARKKTRFDDLDDRGRIIMTRQRSVLQEYVDIKAFPDDPDYLNPNFKWWEYGIFPFIFGPSTDTLREREIATGREIYDEPGLAFKGDWREAIEAVKDVRSWFNYNILRVRVISFRTIQTAIEARLTELDWEKEMNATLSEVDIDHYQDH